MAKKDTAVQWLWRDDKGSWVAYGKEVCVMVEAEFAKGSKKIKLDKERFLDLVVSPDEIKKSFTFVVGPEVIALQRRYDDESKRRPVKREAPQFFDKETILILGEMTKKEKMELTTDVETYGGLVAAKFTRKVTLVFCQESELDNYPDEAKQAKESKVPLVNLDYFSSCVKQGKKVDTKNFLLEVQEKKKPTNKRKKEDSDEEDKKEDKKEVKKEVKKEEKKDENPPKKAKSGEVKKEEPKVEPKKERGENEIFTDAPALKRNTQWMGLSVMESDQSSFPIIMLVHERSKSTFNGIIQWPTLNSAQTKFRGSIAGDTIEFEEYEVLKGEDDVEVPMKYLGKISENTIQGKVAHEEEENACSFKLEKISVPPSKEFDVLKPQTKFEGVCYQPFKI